MLVLRWSDATNNFGKLSLECRRDTPMIRMAVVTFSVLELFVNGGFISALWVTLKFHVVTFMAVLFAAKFIVLWQGTHSVRSLALASCGFVWLHVQLRTTTEVLSPASPSCFVLDLPV